MPAERIERMKNYPSIRYSLQVDHSFPNQLDTLQATPFLQSNGPMKGMSAAEVTVPHSVRRLHAAEGLPEKLLAARQKYDVALPRCRSCPAFAKPDPCR